MAIAVENFQDPDTKLVTLRKKPTEAKLLDIDVTKYVRAGDSISQVDNITAAAQGKVTGSTPLTITLKTHDGAQRLQAKFAGGTDQENYLVTADFQTDGGDTLQVKCMLWVRSTF